MSYIGSYLTPLFDIDLIYIRDFDETEFYKAIDSYIAFANSYLMSLFKTSLDLKAFSFANIRSLINNYLANNNISKDDVNDVLVDIISAYASLLVHRYSEWIGAKVDIYAGTQLYLNSDRVRVIPIKSADILTDSFDIDVFINGSFTRTRIYANVFNTIRLPNALIDIIYYNKNNKINGLLAFIQYASLPLVNPETYVSFINTDIYGEYTPIHFVILHQSSSIDIYVETPEDQLIKLIASDIRNYSNSFVARDIKLSRGLNQLRLKPKTPITPIYPLQYSLIFTKRAKTTIYSRSVRMI